MREIAVTVLVTEKTATDETAKVTDERTSTKYICTIDEAIEATGKLE